MGPAIEVCGWLAIILALVFFDRDTQWPGWQALFPVVGTALIILAARKDSIVTSGFIAQWIGKRSYSLYLWHWPVVVVLIYLDKMSDPVAVAAGVLLSLILGAVSYYLVETPGRKELRQLGPRVACVSLVVLTLAICIPTSVIFVRHGMAGRLSFDHERAFMALKDRAQQTVACDDDCDEDSTDSSLKVAN
jgi:peptidoglycan/LPS O-acetylase OafA/YrhL